ncbi:MAG: hypothetical protein GX250_08785 [Clostridiales bacterium]|jgi:hypothetical protein|nr:hypothetical protein [Clostridiales bacterium]
MLDKFKSRKFLMAAASVVVGILTIFGVPEGVVSLISGISLVLIPVVVYIAAEGRIDAAAVAMASDALREIAQLLAEQKEAGAE